MDCTDATVVTGDVDLVIIVNCNRLRNAKDVVPFGKTAIGVKNAHCIADQEGAGTENDAPLAILVQVPDTNQCVGGAR